MSSTSASEPAETPVSLSAPDLHRLAELAERRSASSTPFTSRVRDQDALAKARLGLACSLFVALRCRHPPTAAHCLRVALVCSAWGIFRRMPEGALDDLEIASLLHDLGKIGVPDSVLCKPLRLSSDERQIMSLKRPLGEEILRACSANREVVEILSYCAAPFDGSCPAHRLVAEEIPLSARMVHIVDAFDSMTTDQVYRPAMSVAAAVDSLRHASGTQFDPDLVEEFIEIGLPESLEAQQLAARRWLTDLAERPADCWTLATPTTTFIRSSAESFQHRLLDSTREGVFFVESSLRIIYWNPAIARVTGISADTVIGMRWEPALLGMTAADGAPLGAGACPVTIAASGGGDVRVQATIQGPVRRLPVRLEIAGVQDEDRTPLGAAVLVRDLSGETSLREQVEDMQQLARRDPMTAALNRRAMDELHEQIFDAARDSGEDYSVIITDIDHFKRVNDTHGHHAGDEAIRAVVGLLRQRARGQEHVARYGGEEFVVLCPGVSAALAAELAEEFRSEVAACRIAALGGVGVTASFGVSEIQEGDTASSMMRRADRALLRAKEAGRNRVIVISRDADATSGEPAAGDALAPRAAGAVQQWNCSLSASCSSDMLVEKIRGFVADHEASVLEVDDDFVELVFDVDAPSTGGRRLLDRRTAMMMRIQFHADENGPGMIINAVVTPHRRRDRRRAELHASAQRLLTSLRAYLMADGRSEDVTASRA